MNESGKHWFKVVSSQAALWMGSPYAFIAAVSLVVGWAIAGPFCNYSPGWELVINTGTTVITFLMVFLIQATQNRDSRALHLKMDELLRATQGARTHMADLSDMSDEDMERLEKAFSRLARFAAKSSVASGSAPPGNPQ
ncbi:MAG: low affinity iron permease family protein [Pseudomonadota bacterium]